MLPLFLLLTCAQTLTQPTTDPSDDIRRPDFTADAGAPIHALAYTADGNTLTTDRALSWDVKNGPPVRTAAPAANKMLELLARKTGAFQVDFSRDYDVLDPKVLAKYDALVMNSTAHLAIPDENKKQALLDYVKGGGGVVGIHAAIDTFKD